MNKLTLFFMLRRNMKLSNKRHPMFEQNKIAIIFTIFGVAFMSIYFIFLGTMLGWGARGGDEELIFAVLPIFLLLDFFMRFGGQQLPSLLIKPYLLMPIRRSDITDCFIVMSMLSSFNLLWLLLLVPFFFIVCCGGLPFSTTMGMLLVCEWLIVINALWYMLVRTLIPQSLWWVVLPIAVYALPLSPMLFLGAEKGFEVIIEFCYDYAYTGIAVAIYAVVTIVLFIINSRLQKHLAASEVAAEEKKDFQQKMNETLESGKKSRRKMAKSFGIVDLDEDGEDAALDMDRTLIADKSATIMLDNMGAKLTGSRSRKGGSKA